MTTYQNEWQMSRECQQQTLRKKNTGKPTDAWPIWSLVGLFFCTQKVTSSVALLCLLHLPLKTLFSHLWETLHSTGAVLCKNEFVTVIAWLRQSFTCIQRVRTMWPLPHFVTLHGIGKNLEMGCPRDELQTNCWHVIHMQL